MSVSAYNSFEAAKVAVSNAKVQGFSPIIVRKPGWFIVGDYFQIKIALRNHSIIYNS